MTTTRVVMTTTRVVMTTTRVVMTTTRVVMPTTRGVTTTTRVVMTIIRVVQGDEYKLAAGVQKSSKIYINIEKIVDFALAPSGHYHQFFDILEFSSLHWQLFVHRYYEKVPLQKAAICDLI